MVVKELGSKGVKTIAFDYLPATLSPCSQGTNVSKTIVCTPVSSLPSPKYTLNIVCTPASCLPSTKYTLNYCLPPCLLHSCTPKIAPCVYRVSQLCRMHWQPRVCAASRRCLSRHGWQLPPRHAGGACHGQPNCACGGAAAQASRGRATAVSGQTSPCAPGPTGLCASRPCASWRPWARPWCR